MKNINDFINESTNNHKYFNEDVNIMDTPDKITIEELIALLKAAGMPRPKSPKAKSDLKGFSGDTVINDSDFDVYDFLDSLMSDPKNKEGWTDFKNIIFEYLAGGIEFDRVVVCLQQVVNGTFKDPYED